MYRALDPAAILDTCELLTRRIEERFPGSGLGKVAKDLLAAGVESKQRIERIRQPFWPIRVCVFLGLLVLLATAIGLVFSLHDRPVDAGLPELLQGLEAGVNDVVFLGVAVFFLLTLEGRYKRRIALRALHELRSIAHVIDMHQLTKDPERFLSPALTTASSPTRTMTRFQLSRYLDYCSELLSITSKLAALYVQYLDDPLILDAVNDIESLTGDLSGKIWQKIVILDTLAMRDSKLDAVADDDTNSTREAYP